MVKTKIYLDTNVPSCLDATDTPERMTCTQRLWESIERGKYSVHLSRATIGEIHKCPEPKHSFILVALAGIKFPLCYAGDDVAEELATLYVAKGGLPPRPKIDAVHIANATLAKCDIITYWNFRHTLRSFKQSQQCRP